MSKEEEEASKEESWSTIQKKKKSNFNKFSVLVNLTYCFFFSNNLLRVDNGEILLKTQSKSSIIDCIWNLKFKSI